MPAGRARLARVLVIAGSDSGGGAGIQADIKTVTALGGYAASAITALTAQNTHGVQAVYDVAPKFVAEQIRVVLDDIGADCLKTGMLHTVEVVHAIVSMIDEKAAEIPLVVDPVMVAKGGAMLLDSDAISAVVDHMIPRARLVTPNAPEAAALVGGDLTTKDDLVAAAERLLDLGAQAALVKGGHLTGDVVYDVFTDRLGERHVFSSPRLVTNQTHGTGCTLASAIATGLAEGLPLFDAVARARAYVYQAIRRAPGIGGGHGPLNHLITVAPFEWRD